MKQEDILLKLNALYDTDVLEHFPKEYLYLYNTPIDKIEEEGKDIIVFGSISDIKSIRTPLSIIRFKINYMNKVLSCAIFNQPFYINVLKKFNKYCLVCRYKKKTKSYIVRYVIKEDSPYLRTKIKPIYTLPKGVSQPDFINLIEGILIQKSQYITNKLPKKICDKYKFEDRYLAFKDVHFPLNEDALKRGLRVFKYEEALQYSLATSVIKKYRNLIKKQVTTLIDINEVDTFINKLTFKLTGDQLNAIHEIVFDMNKTQIMNRLLQGDVGTGKTLVALCALYANYLRHGQGALLAPTKILAQQHYENACKLFKDTPIKIKFLAGNLKTKEKDKINKLIDKYDISTTPILTSLNMKIDDNIAGGDIYSSSNKNNFLLETISDSEDLKGRIKISSSLAKKLGINLNLSNKIHYAYLAKTIYKKEKYYHIFKTGDLEVAEIIMDEKNKIYQNAEFWTIFGITKLLNEEACNISKIILTYDENANINNIKNEFQKNYPNYYFQICGEKIENSIRPIINLIKNVLYFFSGLSCLIATFLLAFSILLVVIEDKNVIMMKNLLGIKKHDIKNEYHALAVFYSLIPGVISFFSVYIMQFSLENILSNVMSNTDYKAGIISSLLTLLLSFFISFSCFPFIDMKITDVLETGNKKYSIKEKINRFLTNR